MRFGFKLWSTNCDWAPIARELYAQGFCDFVELYVVPRTFPHTLSYWKTLDLPVVIHAPHFGHDMNFSLKENWERNKILFDEAKAFCEGLDGRHVVVHLGNQGTLEEAIRQLGLLDCKKVIVENKPQIGLNDSHCVGTSPEEIQTVLRRCAVGFCLDISHAIKFSSCHRLDEVVTLKKFIRLNPVLYHLCDGWPQNFKDEHLNIGRGGYDFKKILKYLPPNAAITLETPKGPEDPAECFQSEVLQLRQMVLQS